MSKIAWDSVLSNVSWDEAGEKFYETGTKNCVLYVQGTDGSYDEGVAWNGITGVTESPSGAEETALYADDDKYISLRSKETFGATIEAYTYPEEFEQCDGSASIASGITIGQQSRRSFGLCYRTSVGNDTDGTDHGYKIHLIYGCTASPSEKAYSTINDSPEAITFSWEVTTVPVAVNGHKNTSTLIIDSRKVAKEKLVLIEKKLYGAGAEKASLPTPNEILELIK